jgi:hypothetical protein
MTTRPDDVLLVVSCDSYRDLWPPFFTLLFRYWPDCPFPVHLGSNEQTYPDPRVHPSKVGPDRDWSSNLLAMLRALPQEGLLLMQEDFLIDKPVQTSIVRELVQEAHRRKAACLRLMPIPGPDSACADHPRLGILRRGADYRVSLQAAWWNRTALMSLLTPGESPWQFERLGSRRSDKMDGEFLSLRQKIGFPLDYYTTAVYRGRWEPDAVRLCRREGIPVDLKIRPMMDAGMLWKRALRKYHVPARLARLLAGSPLRRAGSKNVVTQKEE